MEIKKLLVGPDLYVVATPIGNIEDITVRALRTLKSVDYIACEDSRITNKLLDHYKIKTPMLVYNDHCNEHDRNKIINLITKGNSVALVSDAGTPLISDPGYKLVRLAQQKQIKVTICPGASSVISALVVSGLPTNSFAFIGFLSTKQISRKKQLAAIKTENRTIIIFESANRLVKTLEDIHTVLGDKLVSVIRELTKIYEEVKTAKVSKVIEYYQQYPPKGEIVILIEASTHNNRDHATTIDDQLKHLLQEHSVKDSVEVIAHNFHITKKEIYKRALLLLGK